MVVNSGCDDKQETKVYSVEKAPAESRVTAPQAAGQTAEIPSGHPDMGTGSDMGGGMPSAMPPGHPSIGGGNNSAGMGGGQNPEMDLGAPPANWEAKPPTSMRLASFAVKGEKGTEADVSVILLGGAAGGILDNVNRWQSQLGQPALSADELAHKSQSLMSPLGAMTVVDLQGLMPGADAAKDGRIVAAMVTKDGTTFFFKMRGNAELVGAQKDEFIKWVSSIRFGTAKASPETTTPVSSPDTGGAAGMTIPPKS